MQIMKQRRVTVSETVDTLLLITDDKIVIIIGETFAQERTHIGPLTQRRILKLVYEIMLKSHTKFFI